MEVRLASSGWAVASLTGSTDAWVSSAAQRETSAGQAPRAFGGLAQTLYGCAWGPTGPLRTTS